MNEMPNILIDEQDKHFLSECRWCINTKGYVVNVKYLYKVDGKTVNKTTYLHRLITEAKPRQVVDHINNNKLDNRRSNLRSCTNSQNLMNRGKQRNNTSGFKGVCWSNKDRKWRSQIKLNGKSIYLGDFSDIRDAANAYKRASQKLFKDFSYL